MMKLAIIDSFQHKAKRKLHFLSDLLFSFFDVTYYWEDPASDNLIYMLSDMHRENYDAIILIQPYEKIANYANISCNSIIAIINSYFSSNINSKYFPTHMKYISLSKFQHEILKTLGLESEWIQYFPNPYDFNPRKIDYCFRGFYRYKSPEISPKILTQLMMETKFDNLHVHDSYIMNKKSLSLHMKCFKNTSVTTSKWLTSKSDYISLLSKSNVYFAPNLYDISPNSILEAMSLGMCVVSPDLPSVNEYIVDGENGLLYDAENPAPLDFTNINAICKRARESIEEGYDTWLNNRKMIFKFITGVEYQDWDWSEAIEDNQFIASSIQKYIDNSPDIRESSKDQFEGGKRCLGEEARNPLLTIVTVVKNSEASLEKTIHSVLHQTFSDFEYIIIDGLSSDATVDIIKNYNSAIDYWVSEPDQGPYHAMNKALNHARGYYILFMNSGDWFASASVLESLFKNIVDKPDVVYGDHIWLDNGKPHFHKSIPFSAIQGMLSKGKNTTESWYHGLPNHQSTLVKTELLKTYKFDLIYRYAADYDFLFKVASKNASFMQINLLISVYQSGGFSSKNEKLCHLEWTEIFKKYGFLGDHKTLSGNKIEPFVSSIQPTDGHLNEVLSPNPDEIVSDVEKRQRYSLQSVNECSRVYLVTPCLNAIDTIDHTIYSVVTQSMGDFIIRYHVQDAGSTDGTLECLKKWNKRLNPRSSQSIHDHYGNIIFSYSSEPDNGMYDAITRGFAYIQPSSPNAIMSWINADDILVYGSLSTILKVFRKYPQIHWITGHNSLIGYQDEIVGYNDEPKPTEFIKSGICDGQNWRFVQQEGTFFRKHLWDEVGGFNKKLKYAADWDLWRRFAREAELVHFPGPLAAFRLRPGQISGTNINAYRDEIDNIVSSEKRLEFAEKLLKKSKNEFSVFSVCFRNNQYTIETHALSKFRIPNMGKKIFRDDYENNEVCSYQAELNNKNTDNDTTISYSEDRDLEILISENLPKFDNVNKNLLIKIKSTKNIVYAEGWRTQKEGDADDSLLCNGKGFVHCISRYNGRAALSLTIEAQIPEYSIHLKLNGQAIDTVYATHKVASIKSKKININAGTNVLEIYCSGNFKRNEKKHEKVPFTLRELIFLPPKYGNQLHLFSHSLKVSKRYFFKTFYLNQISDNKKSKILSPIKHYLLYGAWECKDPNPLFSSKFYLDKNRDVYIAGMNPLLHYIRHGWKEGRDPHPDFSTSRYLQHYKDVKESGLDPLLHYLIYGIYERRKIYSCVYDRLE